MITMLGSPRRCCDGVTRRETLKAGALSLLGGGFNLPTSSPLEEQRPADARPGKAKSVILLYLLGGAATQDMWDLKPDAPAGVRGEFKPIATNVPGVRSLRASAAHGPVDAPGRRRPLGQPQGRLPQLPAAYTGCEVPQPDQHPRDTTRRAWARVCEYLNTRPGDLPAYVYMPCWLGWGQAFRRGRPLRRLPRQALRPADHRVPARIADKGATPARRPPAGRPRRAAAARQRPRRRADHRPPRRTAATCCNRSTTSCRASERPAGRRQLRPHAAAGLRPAHVVAGAAPPST